MRCLIAMGHGVVWLIVGLAVWIFCVVVLVCAAFIWTVQEIGALAHAANSKRQ